MLPKPLRFLHPYLHFVGLLLMVAGLPFSNLLISLSNFFVGGNWILEGNYLEKWNRFKQNKAAIAICGIYLMLVPALLLSSNLNEALKILRINLPFLIYGFVLGSSPPLPEKWYQLLIRLFILNMFFAVVACSILGLPRWLNGELPDIRSISVFISHIRFSLLIDLAILLILWILVKKPFPAFKFEHLLLGFIGTALLLFLFVLQSLNGIIILLFVSGIWIMIETWKRFKPATSLVLYCIPVLIAGLTFYWANRAWNDYFTPNAVYASKLPDKTPLGNAYSHELSAIENGHYVNAFVCESEIRNTWPKRSTLPIDSTDAKGHPVYTTLVRFLNSKGLTKDQKGIMALSDKEIRYIENGTANIHYTGLWGIRMRFYQLLYELDYQKRGGTNASGHTLMMKLEFWKNGLALVRKNPVTGTGMGDIPDDFKQQYYNTASWLSPQWWMTSHNQFIYIAVGTGIPGLFLFLFLMLYPALKKRAFHYLPFVFFFSIAFLAMFTEDMLTTQVGVSFVAFFYCFFLFARPMMSDKASSTSSSSESSLPKP